MSDEVQGSAFPDLVPEVPVSRAVKDDPIFVPKSPGWRLIATTSGPKGFHLVKSVGTYNSVRTPCGLTGRVVADSERMIAHCAACEAAVAARL
jgi:hypothetical protein